MQNYSGIVESYCKTIQIFGKHMQFTLVWPLQKVEWPRGDS